MKLSRCKISICFILVWVLCMSICGFAATNETSNIQTSDAQQNNEIFLFIGSEYAYVNNKPILIDPSNTMVKPFISNGKALIPLRFIAENFNATVEWDDASSTAKVSLNEKVIRFTISHRQYSVNNINMETDTESQIFEGRTFVPCKELAEAFEQKICWDDRGLIIISSYDNYLEKQGGREKVEAIINTFKGSDDKMKRAPHILLRSSWQVLNIGDIAHTPGVLALIEKYLPEAEVILWASDDITPEVMNMEHKRFPNLRIVTGRIGADGKGENEDLDNAIKWSDFLLHGSGPSLVGYDDLKAYVGQTNKPFGVFGITYSAGNAEFKSFLSKAKFIYFRDSVSLEKAKADGIASPVMEFGPDGAFATDLRNDAVATEFMRANDLQEGAFLCVIPRLRYTPYWEIRSSTPFNADRNERNEVMKEHDHAPLRDAITEVVRKTGLKILVCPEDLTQMKVGKELIFDKLPEDVRAKVVWREKFWLPDEALSIYVRSAGLFGNEMHSPIMCIGNGIPAIVCRWKEQTSKGFMWQDIGLNDWLFDMDNEEDIKKIVPTVLELALNLEAAKEKVSKARSFVQELQREMVNTLKQELVKVVK